MNFSRFYFMISLLLVVGSFFYLCGRKPIPVGEVFPGKVWAKPVSFVPSLEGVGEPTAKNCGSCHTEIYEEWKSSTHANALSDIQFQSELAKPSSPKWLCLNCHIPMENQRETLVVALEGGDPLSPITVPNPSFSKQMMSEAITCATCHVRVDENTNKSYVIGSNGKTNPPHPVRMDSSFLKNRCLDCHNETYTLNESLVCSFQTGDEMIKSNPSQTCAQCHMPEVRRSFVKKELGKPIRKSHKHGFVGGGIPKQFSLYPKQVPLGYQSALTWENFQWKPQSLLFQVRNARAGHSFPSGDPERFFVVYLRAESKEGIVFAETKFRIGQTWEWSPVAKKIADNRLLANEVRSFEFPLPKGLDGKGIRIRIEAKLVRLSDSVAKYMKSQANFVPEEYRSQVEHIQDLYPQSSVVYRAILEYPKTKPEETPIEELMRENANRRGE